MTTQPCEYGQANHAHTTPARPYVQSMDGIRLSAEQKEDLVNSILAQYAGTAGTAAASGPVTAATSPAPAPAATQAQRTPHASRISRRSFVALLSAAAVGAGAAGAAVALNQTHISVSDILETFFGGSSGSGGGNSGSEPAIGSSIGASATSDGVTITVDSAVGDATTAAIVLTIEREDGSDLGASRSADTGELDVQFGTESDGEYTPRLRIDGVTSFSAGMSTYDADPDDNAVQAMYSIRVDEPFTLIGRAIHLHIVSLVDSGAATSGVDPSDWPVIAQGPWDLDFTLDYEDSTRFYDAGQAVVTYKDIDATPTSIRVSQVALSLEFDTVTHADQAESILEQMDWDNEFMNLPASLVMDDETVLDLGYDETATGPQIGGSASMSSDYPGGLDPDDPSGDYEGTASRQLFFSRIIDPSRVRAVILNGTRIDLELVE